MTDHDCPDFCKHRAQEKVMDRQDVMDDGLPAKCCGRCRHRAIPLLDLDADGSGALEFLWCLEHSEKRGATDCCLVFELQEF